MIYRYKPETEFMTEERCSIVEIMNSSQDNLCSIAQARVKPGVTTTLHRVKGVVERYIILSGEGTVFIGESEPETVREKDVVRIDANVPQKIANKSDKEDLIFLCVCTPGFTVDAYEDLEI